MASRSLGVLTLDLVAKIGGFTAGMDQASRVADKRMREIEKRANAFGRSIGGAIKSAGAQFLAFAGVTLTVGAAFDKLKGAIDLADQTRDLSIRLGVSTETLSAFGYAAGQTGTDIETLGKGMKILAKNAADSLNPTSEQAKVFAALGVKVTDANGKLKDMAQLVPEIADKFKLLEDGTTKAALAQALFGKAGLDLTEFLNQGADGLQTFTDKARALGIVISQDTADAADKFNDDLDDLKTASTALALKIAEQLLPVIDDLVIGVKSFVSDGDNAADIAHSIADGFRDMVEAGKGIGAVFKLLQGLQTTLFGLENQGNAVTRGLLAAMQGNLAGIKAAVFQYKEASRQVEAGGRGEKYDPLRGSSFQNVVSGISTAAHPERGASFQSVIGNATTATPGASAYEKGIAEALSNPTGASGSKGKKAGKSEAEKDAERLKEAYDRLIESQKEQIALFGQTSEASQVRYDTEFGDLKNLTQAQKDAAIANAERLDQMREEAEVQKDLDEANKRREENVAQLLTDLQNEYTALGLNNEQQEIFNNLHYAGVDALSAEGQEIVAWTQKVQQARESRAIIDDLKDATKDFFVDLADGAGSAREAWDDFFDGIKRRALEFVADKVINQFFDMLSGKGSSSGGASSGGFWAGLLGLFGGGGGFGGAGSPLAGGGWTDPMKYHQVGEYDRPELLLKNGKQYLLPGDRGRVVPMSGGGGEFNQTVIFNSPHRMDNRTQNQFAQKQGDAAREAMRRNSGR